MLPDENVKYTKNKQTLLQGLTSAAAACQQAHQGGQRVSGLGNIRNQTGQGKNGLL